jgi:hypothetical protein
MHGSDALMPENGFTRALQRAKEIKISVIGRNTGKLITLPVWLLRDADRSL